MRTGYVLLLSGLLLSSAGCRELGGYLSPEELDACESGARTEDCPTELQPSATVTFQEPHVLVAGEPYALPELGRYLELRFRVESVLDIERVDLSCRGLQLASWRPVERHLALDLEATVDLFPCRAVSTLQPGGDVDLHEVPIEVRVLGPVGGQVVLDDWTVVVNLSDARVPDSRALIEVTLESDASDANPVGGRPAAFRVISGEPDDPLAGPLEVWVDGIRVADAVSQEAGAGSYLIRLPRGLRTRHTSGSTLAELLAPKEARVTVTGTTQSGRNSVGRLAVPVQKERGDPASAPELSTASFHTAQGIPVTHPVAVPAPPGGESPGTLFLAADHLTERVHLFNADDAWEPLLNRSGGWVYAFTAEGRVLWQEEPWTASGVLQTDLSPTAPEGPPVPLPMPAHSDVAFRLGNGAVCSEILEPGASVCGAAPSTWEVQCVHGDGSFATIDLTGIGGSRDPAWITLGLQDGWVSAQYRALDCPVSQAVGAWNAEPMEMQLSPLVEGDINLTNLTVLISAGPERAVIGHVNDGLARLELIDVAGGGTSLGGYFAPPANAVLEWDDVLLWADAEGGLVLLRSTGVMERWLPGAATPAQRINLSAWAGGAVRGIAPNYSFGAERFTEVPRIVHSNGDTTVLLSHVNSEGDISLLALELDRHLTPVWAHLEPIWADTVDSFRAVPAGLPDGPYFDVAAWQLAGVPSQVFRWAR